MTDWQLIVKRHGPTVWRAAYRLLSDHTDASDCYGEVFVCAFEISKRQRVRNFGALLVHIATSRAIDRLRKRYSDSRVYTNGVGLDSTASGSAGPVDIVQGFELRDRLRRALGQLPPKQAEVFCLRHLNDMSYRQIGKLVGIKSSNVGVMLNRARGQLRILLEAGDCKDEL